jgi:cation:H+ antiporter
MTDDLIRFFGSAIVIVISGVCLTRCADSISELTGFGRLFIGSILLASATSLPELAVGINAVQIGEADLAVGELMGSSLINLLILAVLDLSHPARGCMLSRLSAAHALPAAVGISLTALAALAIFLGPRYSQTLLNLGPGSWAILVAYALGVRLVFYDQRVTAALTESKQSLDSPRSPFRLLKAIAGFLLATLAILLTSPTLASSAATLADHTGLGGTFVGTTLVALCTSLPELVSSLTAVRLGAFDLAIGNIFGSNSFNMALLVVLDAVQPGSLFSLVSSTHVLTALATILTTAVAIVGQLYQVEKRRFFLEPEALLVIILILCALMLIYLVK